MSGLAAVLAGRTAPGVYRWHAAFDRETVQHTVEHAGHRFGYVDGWTAPDKAAFLDAVAGALDFPPHYGRNLDALADCLHDVDDGTVLLWDGWGVLAREDPRTFTVLHELLGASGLTVLLRGEGPEVDVADLD